MSNMFENKLMEILDSQLTSSMLPLSQEGINLLIDCIVTPGPANCLTHIVARVRAGSEGSTKVIFFKPANRPRSYNMSSKVKVARP